LGEALGCISFCAVTIPLREGAHGRLLLISNRHRFNTGDLSFFQQMAQQLGPRIVSASLLDHLARQVADYERQRISRDMHDSAIQPYIGLKFALEALARKVPVADPISIEIGKLVEMTNTEIAELRRYVKNLRREGERGHAALIPAVRRQAGRFAELYGIHITVNAPDDLSIGDELAEDAFHMIGEALSNIRRHTDASRARIDLQCDGKSLLLRVTNPNARTAPATFTPRSITERATSLGGTCHVDRNPAGETEVVVELPLDQGKEAFAA
jgi:signal transduction histidine kinase